MNLRQVLTGTVTALALAGTLTTTTASAATVSHPTTRTQLHTLMSACVHGQTFSIDATTYVCTPAPAAGHYPTRAYTRTCHAYARWEAAGLPSDRQTSRLARAALRLGASLPDRVLYADVTRLLLTMVAHTNGEAPAMWVSRDCHTD